MMFEITSIHWISILGGFIIIGLIKIIHAREITIKGHTAQITSLLSIGYSVLITMLIIGSYLV